MNNVDVAAAAAAGGGSLSSGRLCTAHLAL